VGEPNSQYDEDCVDDLHRGADVVLCNQSARELVTRIRAILRRKDLETRQSLHSMAGGVQMDLDRHEVWINGKLVELTPKEF
jgi:DNA-binding response OmpR family regulator